MSSDSCSDSGFELVGETRLLYGKPARNAHRCRPTVGISDPPFRQHRLAVPSLDGHLPLNADPLNMLARYALPCRQDSARCDAQEGLGRLNGVEDDGIHRANSTAFLKPVVLQVEGGQL